MSDSEVSATSYRVSLLCPLGKVKMNYPCRAKSCSHLQCFDAELYLQMNEKKSTWICPICDKSALYADLILDDLFTEILQQSKCFEEIEFDQDGSWYSISDRGEKGRRMPNLFPIPLTSPSANKPPIILELSPSSDGKSTAENSDTSESYISSPSSPPAPICPPPEPVKNSNYIDLTLDSDTESEEEGPSSTTRTMIPPTAYHGPQRAPARYESPPALLDMSNPLPTDSIQYLPHQITSPLPKTHHHVPTSAINSGALGRKHPISPVQQTHKRLVLVLQHDMCYSIIFIYYSRNRVFLTILEYLLCKNSKSILIPINFFLMFESVKK